MGRQRFVSAGDRVDSVTGSGEAAEGATMTRWGTSHFESIAAAEKYYRCYGVTKDNVGRKIAEGEIHIGKPETKDGQHLGLDEDRRYWIEEAA